MRIAVAVKQVLDPEAVNSYALWGKLAIDSSGRRFAIGDAIPLIINTYDEQALEVAFRIREAGTPVEIAAFTVGPSSAAEVLKRGFALGVDAGIHIETALEVTNGFEAGMLLAGAMKRLGPFDLVLCGRQGSDFDQGVVPGVLAEALGAALVSVAAGAAAEQEKIIVHQVTPDGVAVVEAVPPAVVSVSNEVGQVRYPTSRGMLEARRKRPQVMPADELGPIPQQVELVGLEVPDVQGQCEMIENGGPAEKAAVLLKRLASLGVLR